MPNLLALRQIGMGVRRNPSFEKARALLRVRVGIVADAPKPRPSPTLVNVPNWTALQLLKRYEHVCGDAGKIGFLTSRLSMSLKVIQSDTDMVRYL